MRLYRLQLHLVHRGRLNELPVQLSRGLHPLPRCSHVFTFVPGQAKDEKIAPGLRSRCCDLQRFPIAIRIEEVITRMQSL